MFYKTRMVAGTIQQLMPAMSVTAVSRAPVVTHMAAA